MSANGAVVESGSGHRKGARDVSEIQQRNRRGRHRYRRLEIPAAWPPFCDRQRYMTSSSSARATGFLFLAVTSVGWALNWAAIKILLREWPPLFSRGVSGVAAAVLLAGVAAAFGESLKVPKR
jgi:hypothetical protein